MPPHDTPDSDPAFRALRSRVDRLERAREQRLDRLERLVVALAAETDPPLARDPAVETLLDAIADEGVSDVDHY